MKKQMTLLSAIVIILFSTWAFAQDTTPPALRTYYFGNSLTGCTDPDFHADLGKSDGVQWTAEANLGAGWQLWQHRHEISEGGVAFDRGSKGALTIEQQDIDNAPYKIKKFFASDWDAIVLQPFSFGLRYKAEEMWGKKFGEERDLGDIQSSIDIIDTFLKKNPEGKVYIYQNWPTMKPGKIPADDQLPEWAVEMKKRAGKIRNAEFPDREAFNYEKAWAEDKHSPTTDPKRFWLQENARSRDYHQKLFSALKEHYPELWKQGRLKAIPVGDIFLALDKKMQAGEFPGITTIKDYYTDIQHTRAGLARYTAAAAFFAVMFDKNPEALDWKIYNDAERYNAKFKNGPRDPHHDMGPLLGITPERARIVNETIWEVVQKHPLCNP